MSQAAIPLQHPYQRCAAVVAAAVDDAVGSSPVFLSPDGKREVLLDLSRQIARLEGMRLALLGAAGEVAERDAARDPGSWLAVEARLGHPEGRRLQQLAEALDARYGVLAAALLAGAVSRPQAEVIAGALDELPATVEPDLRARAEAHLVEQAAEFGPRELRVLGGRILDVIAPEVAEDHERQALEAAEQRARRRMRVTRRELGDGLVRITADLPTLHADLLLTHLHAFASPRREHATGDSQERKPYPRRLAAAFCSLLERLPSGVVPEQGGSAATLVVTIDQEKLARDLGVARLSTGTAISVGEARRLACGAGILPMVLGGTSQPLDVGRTKRFHTPAMRKALAVRDRECRASGCDIPAAWCEVVFPRSRGHRHSGRKTTERCLDDDLFAGVQGPDRRAASPRALVQ